MEPLYPTRYLDAAPEHATGDSCYCPPDQSTVQALTLLTQGVFPCSTSRTL